MGLVFIIRQCFYLLWYFVSTLIIRLYRIPRQLIQLFVVIFSEKRSFKKLYEEILCLGILFLDLIAVPEIYEFLGILFKRKMRGLTSKEIEMVNMTLGDVLPLHLVKLDNHAKLTSANRNIAYVSMFTINNYGTLKDETFVHELVHIWQYTRYGSAYIIRALFAQHSHEGYDYGGPSALMNAFAENRNIQDFNFEQQGDILSDYFNLLKNEKIMSPAQFLHLKKIYHYFVNQFENTNIYRW